MPQPNPTLESAHNQIIICWMPYHPVNRTTIRWRSGQRLRPMFQNEPSPLLSNLHIYRHHHHNQIPIQQMPYHEVNHTRIQSGGKLHQVDSYLSCFLCCHHDNHQYGQVWNHSYIMEWTTVLDTSKHKQIQQLMRTTCDLHATSSPKWLVYNHRVTTKIKEFRPYSKNKLFIFILAEPQLS